ncbi:MAG: hypothetical protein GX998_04240 [Firmicutes bacterium]|nr:hypothetical protein [Bacillota bacterium]
MFWVISFRGLIRSLRLVIRPIVIVLVIVLILCWISGRFGGKEPDAHRPLLPEDGLPFSQEFDMGPRVMAAATCSLLAEHGQAIQRQEG